MVVTKHVPDFKLHLRLPHLNYQNVYKTETRRKEEELDYCINFFIQSYHEG